MTSKLTREENVQAVFDLKAGYTLGLADVEILKRVARMTLAAMDCEPVAALKLPQKLSNDRERAHELNTGVDTWNRCIDEVAKINGEMIIAGRVDGLHPSTMALVNDFATALAEKLHKAELKYGYSNAWTNNGWMTECLAEFHRHIAKGDPRDVAAYCAFMWYHGWKTEAAQPSPVVSEVSPLASELPAPVAQKEPISFDEWSRKCALQITLCYPDFREKAQYIWDSARETQQPAPVVPEDVLDALQKVARIRLDLNGFDGDRRGIADCLCDAEEALIEVVNRRAAMLQGAENAESRCGIQTAPALDSFKKNSESRCGNSPVIPDGSKEALSEAVAAIYFTDSTDYLPALYSVVKALSPEIFAQLLSNEKAAFDATRLPAAPQEVSNEK